MRFEFILGSSRCCCGFIPEELKRTFLFFFLFCWHGTTRSHNLMWLKMKFEGCFWKYLHCVTTKLCAAVFVVCPCVNFSYFRRAFYMCSIDYELWKFQIIKTDFVSHSCAHSCESWDLLELVINNLEWAHKIYAALNLLWLKASLKWIKIDWSEIMSLKFWIRIYWSFWTFKSFKYLKAFDFMKALKLESFKFSESFWIR